MQMNRALDVETLAKWLDIPMQYIEKPWGGDSAFLDCVEYLTHSHPKQQELGKYLYPDEEVKANFDFKEELNKRAENKLKYGKDLSKQEQIMYDIMYNGLTLKQAMQRDEFIYMQKFQQLSKMRMDYLSRQSVPPVRVNFYICGIGGAGKGVASRALARSFFPGMEDDEIFFEVGAKGALFEGYDGQPIVIWNDKRAFNLLEELGGRDNVFEIFDTHPSNHKQNIKYGSIKLINSINIVNSVQPYDEFLDGLAGAYKTKNGETIQTEMKYKGQSWRRFFCCIPLHEKDLDILLSKYNMGTSEEPTEYEVWKSVVGNFKNVRTLCQNNELLARKIEDQLIGGLAEKTQNEIINKEPKQTEEELLSYFEKMGYGDELPLTRTIQEVKL